MFASEAWMLLIGRTFHQKGRFVMMKVRCNDSIKRLITSTEFHFDDGLTVDQRFDTYLIPVKSSYLDISHKDQVGDLNDSVRNSQAVIPFAFVTSAPKSFDPTRSYESNINVEVHQQTKTILDSLLQEWKPSTSYNNLGESILLGRAVYSWVRSLHKTTFVRETESHLPEGTYQFKMFVAVVNKVDGVCYPCLINQGVDVSMTLVSKKQRTKSRKSQASLSDPEESVQSLLDEYDNIKD